MEPLPEYDGAFLGAEQLLEKIKQSEATRCLDRYNKPALTIVDYRTENILEVGRPIPSIKTQCQTIQCLLDDLKDPQVRAKIPKEGLVIVVSETGNRDWAVMRYLHRWGYSNVMGLEFGMRGWIKLGYPIDIPE